VDVLAMCTTQERPNYFSKRKNESVPRFGVCTALELPKLQNISPKRKWCQVASQPAMFDM
jgi:hypothetical protein